MIDFRKPKPREPGRLVVARRKRNWKKVHYMPVRGAEPDHDGFVEPTFYTYESGAAKPREPMEGENNYIPYFDPRNAESGSKKERDRLIAIDYYRVWKYLDETDNDVADKMEEEYSRDYDSPRWRAIMEDAKAWRKTHRRGRTGRRTGRQNNATTTSAPAAAANIINGKDDDSDDAGADSTYESEDEAFRRQRNGQESMGPPRSTRPLNRRRNGSDSDSPAPKRSRPNPTNRRDGSVRAESPSLFMSGAGSFSPQVPRPSGLLDRNGGDTDDDDDDLSTALTPRRARRQAEQRLQQAIGQTGATHQHGSGHRHGSTGQDGTGIRPSTNYHQPQIEDASDAGDGAPDDPLAPEEDVPTEQNGGMTYGEAIRRAREESVAIEAQRRDENARALAALAALRRNNQQPGTQPGSENNGGTGDNDETMGPDEPPQPPNDNGDD